MPETLDVVLSYKVVFFLGGKEWHWRNLVYIVSTKEPGKESIPDLANSLPTCQVRLRALQKCIWWCAGNSPERSPDCPSNILVEFGNRSLWLCIEV